MRLLLAAALSIALTAGAHAADPGLPMEEPPVITWSGGYVGLHAGYAWGSQSSNLDEALGPQLRIQMADSFDVDGFVGGLHAGYNWQSGSLVYGIEGDIDYANIESGAYFDYGLIDGDLSLESDWQGSLRLRAGYAVDTWLFYATGGVAFGHAELIGAGSGYSFSDDNTHVGWTIGAGAEKAFTPNWIGRIEARYTDFGSEEYGLGGLTDIVESEWDQTTVNLGLSYKF